MSDPLRAETPKLNAAVRFLEQAPRVARAEVALVLGSGLKHFADAIDDRHEVPFTAIPYWPVPRIEGHGASLVLGRVGGVVVACLTGRVHLYEGHDPHEVVRPVRTLALAGVRRFLLTNAAGGIARVLRAGDLMVLRDHLNLTGRSPLLGPHEAALGPRFPDQSRVYRAELRARLHAADPGLHEGVYAGLLGPSYETPAEIRMLATMGADAVGMSTVLEAVALNALGAEVAGVSLISNSAAGIADTPLSHDEVVAAGRAAEPRFAALLQGFCSSFA
ncbi:MAG: purine-nucleoside phosphorylase [Planctomycetes bacterium]|nr:purine-nucleoside phosphorylase [Planctomycetota bacterium]